MAEDKKAVILFSGGLNSTSVLSIAKDRGYKCFCLSFRYGQRQDIELKRALEIAKRQNVQRHLILRLDLNAIGGSTLTTDTPGPKNRTQDELKKGIPVTYVPGRNIIFLSHALAWAEVVGAADIFPGINAVDYSGYPDRRPEFLTAFATMANPGTKSGGEGTPFQLHTPLLAMSKKEIIQTGIQLGWIDP